MPNVSDLRGMKYNVVTIFVSGVEKKLSYLKVIIYGTYISSF